MSGDYHGSRLAPDLRRGQVWKALWRYYFAHRIRATDCVLDLGAGYGDFINAEIARTVACPEEIPSERRYVCELLCLANASTDPRR